MFALRVVVALLIATACGGPRPYIGSVEPRPTATPEPLLGPPNFVVILADDLGWGDTGPYGNTVIKTPTLDRMAAEGVKLTSFYVPSPICAPSRAALMTGRYASRNGIFWNPPNRLNDGELTIADVLHARGYATGMVGKWHLGWVPADFPTHHGFEFYYGIPAGEDALVGPGAGGQGFYEGHELDVDPQPTTDVVGIDVLTRHYTERAIGWMKSLPKDQPFFLYLAPRSVHLDLWVTDPFAGKSAGGAYGDVLEELDFTVGEVLQALADMGADKNTLVVFASDNGPVNPPGSVGPFTGNKGKTQEGGVRVPGLVRWPARIPAGRISAEPASTLDLLPTFVALAKGDLPAGRIYDGADITGLLTGALETLPGPGLDGHRELVFWYSQNPTAIRSGKWKYSRPAPWTDIPQLFDLDADPAETRNIIGDYPDVAQRLDEHIEPLVAR